MFDFLIGYSPKNGEKRTGQMEILAVMTVLEALAPTMVLEVLALTMVQELLAPTMVPVELLALMMVLLLQAPTTLQVVAPNDGARAFGTDGGAER